jgi:hypothetical protein
MWKKKRRRKKKNKRKESCLCDHFFQEKKKKDAKRREIFHICRKSETIDNIYRVDASTNRISLLFFIFLF